MSCASSRQRVRDNDRVGYYARQIGPNARAAMGPAVRLAIGDVKAEHAAALLVEQNVSHGAEVFALAREYRFALHRMANGAERGDLIRVWPTRVCIGDNYRAWTYLLNFAETDNLTPCGTRSRNASCSIHGHASPRASRSRRHK